MLHINASGLVIETKVEDNSKIGNYPVTVIFGGKEEDLESNIRKDLSRSVVSYRILQNKDPRSQRQTKFKKHLRKAVHQLHQKINDTFWIIDRYFLR